MTVVLMTDPVTNRVALYDEAPGGGDPKDPNSARNAPLNNPVAHLDKIYFHSDFNYIEVALLASATISHAGFAAASPVAWNGNAGTGGSQGFAIGNYSGDHLLASHSLGVIPRFRVVTAGQMLPTGFPVQATSSGATRYVSAYATTTQIRLKEFANAGWAATGGISVDYQVMVFAEPPAPTGNLLFDWDPTTGILTLARGRWRSDRRYLQVVPGGSPFAMIQGRNIDLNNGAARTITPNGTIVENVPADLQLTVHSHFPSWGPTMNYKGSFASAPSILVQAP